MTKRFCGDVHYDCTFKSGKREAMWAYIDSLTNPEAPAVRSALGDSGYADHCEQRIYLISRALALYNAAQHNSQVSGGFLNYIYDVDARLFDFVDVKMKKLDMD